MVRKKSNVGRRGVWMAGVGAAAAGALLFGGRAVDAAGALGGIADATARTAQTTVPIDIARSLMITDLSVVNDPVRTRWSTPTRTPLLAPATTSRTRATATRPFATATALPAALQPVVNPDEGAWTFGQLMTDMAGANDPSDFVMSWLEHWEQDQQVNGFNAPARTQIRTRVINPWLAASGGQKLDLKKAPFRLLAIVNRIDLRKNPVYSAGNAGEGRFVFGVLDQNGNTMEFTVILEYELPAATLGDVKRWANEWHALNSIPFGPDYNRALQALTKRFAGRNAAPHKTNGSAINQVRTNELAIGSPWEMREFVLASRGGMLVQTTVKQEPDQSFNGSQALAAWANANAAAIKAERHEVPASMLGARSPVSFVWSQNGIADPDVRHKFALNTCNGCHQPETGTRFTHVFTRGPNQPSGLSGFLTGVTISDPISGQPRTFNDLERRRLDLQRVLTASTFHLAAETPRMAVH